MLYTSQEDPNYCYEILQNIDSHRIKKYRIEKDGSFTVFGRVEIPKKDLPMILSGLVMEN